MINLLRACRLLALCIAINRYTPSAFFDFSGHVDWVKIRIYTNGWNSDFNAHCQDFCIAFRRDNFKREYIEVLRYLKSLKKKCAGSGNSEMAHTE